MQGIYEHILGDNKPNISKQGKAIVRCWRINRASRAGHISVEIIDGNKHSYISVWSLENPDLLANKSVGDNQYPGIYFVTSLADDQFIEGYRAYKYDEYRQQKRDGNVTIPTAAKSILEQRETLGTEEINKIMRLGEPEDTVSLYSLDTSDMQSYIDQMKANTKSWYFWCGSTYPNNQYAKCSSAGLRVLYAGGMNKLLSSNAHMLRLLAGVTSMAISPLISSSWYGCLFYVLRNTAIAGFLGGLVDGNNYIQSFKNLIMMNKADTPVYQTGMIQLLSVLATGICSAIGYDNVGEKFFVLPENVIDMAHNAARGEVGSYNLSPSAL